jgi:hypothetical protein
MSTQTSSSNHPLHALKHRLNQLLDEVLAHDGFGTVKVEVRLLKRGQKEVILDCGKQYRFVIDHPSPSTGQGAVEP